MARPGPGPEDRPGGGHLTEISNIAVLVPQAEPVLAAANRRMPPDGRLTAPAHITLVYPFMPPPALTAPALDDLRMFFSDRPALAFELALGWFGREILLLRPEPASGLVELTEAILERWPAYPYYGGAHDVIEPHLTLAFGTAGVLETIAASLASQLPLRAHVDQVTLLVGPEQDMRAGPSFPLRSAEAQ